MTPEELEQIVLRCRAGVPVKVIAADLQIDRRKVRKVLHEAGAARPRATLTRPQIADAVRMYEEGASLTRVGERFGPSAGTIRARLLNAGVEIRPRAESEQDHRAHLIIGPDLKRSSEARARTVPIVLTRIAIGDVTIARHGARLRRSDRRGWHRVDWERG